MKPSRRPGPGRLRLALVLLSFVAAAPTLTACTTGPAPVPDGPVARIASTGTSGTVAAASAQPIVTPSAVDALPSPPLFPEVAALAWLDGPSAAPAIRVKEDGFTRWQGAAPGEQAEMLPDGAYRWVGPDGSMVGCALSPDPVTGRSSHRRCVAVDAAGNTAVTGSANALRTVFGPDGRLLGLYQATGAVVRDPGPPESLPAAIAASGVDMAALLDFGTRRAPFAGGITGDPHLITIGGIRVTDQSVGDFEARIGDPARRIQIRVEPMPYQSDVGYVTAAAVDVPSHTIEFSLTAGLVIDGGPTGSSGRFVQTSLPGGPVVGLWPADAGGITHVVVLWPDGSTVYLSGDPSLGLSVIARLPTAPVSGLFGTRTASDDGGSATTPTVPVPDSPDIPDAGQRGDFAPRSGSEAVGSSVGQVVDSWRVPPTASPFPDTVTVTAPSGPGATISPMAVQAAGTACAAGGMAGSQDLAACVFDVSRTGDDGYVLHHSELVAAATAPVLPASLTADWPALTLGVVASPRDVALGEQIQDAVVAGGRSYYRLTLSSPTDLDVTGSGCSAAQTERAMAKGAAALRVFDSSGNPVSSRGPLCGSIRTGALASGVYYLVVAGPVAGPAAAVRFRVRST